MTEPAPDGDAAAAQIILPRPHPIPHPEDEPTTMRITIIDGGRTDGLAAAIRNAPEGTVVIVGDAAVKTLAERAAARLRRDDLTIETAAVADARDDPQPEDGADDVPDGITPAAACVAAVLRRPHAPHLWAWNPDPDPARPDWLVVADDTRPRPAGTRWCDGGTPGHTR